MGLDQYGLKRKNEKVEEIAYFRKHNALHGFMEDLWISKGRPLPAEKDGTITYATKGDDFNCIPLELTEDDLIQLGKEAKAYNLPQTEGFFFGSDSSQDEDRKNDVLEFVAKGLEALREGYEVAYSSWW